MKIYGYRATGEFFNYRMVYTKDVINNRDVLFFMTVYKEFRRKVASFSFCMQSRQTNKQTSIDDIFVNNSS